MVTDIFKERIKAMKINNGVLIKVDDKDIHESGHYEIAESVSGIGFDASFLLKQLMTETLLDSVTHFLNYALAVCKNITTATFIAQVIHIGNYAFSGLKNLRTVTLPENVTHIGYYAFVDCINLTTVTLPASVTQIGWCAFLRCPSLTDIVINAVEGSDAYERIKDLLPYDLHPLVSGLMPTKAAIQGCDDSETANDKTSKTSEVNTFFQNTSTFKSKLNEAVEFEYRNRP